MAKKTGKATANPADAISLLESQHREVEELFSEITETTTRASKKRVELFEQIAHKLECHAQIEEQLFYPDGKDVDKDMTLEAYEEHGVVRMLIDQIKATDPADEKYLAKVTVLKEVVEHHVEEEEDEYFPKVRKELGKERISELGIEMKARFDELDAAIPLGPNAKDAAERAAVGGAAQAKKNAKADVQALL